MKWSDRSTSRLGAASITPRVLSAMAVACAMAAGRPAAAQVTARFYAPVVTSPSMTIPGPAPSPTSPYPYGSLVCTIGSLGTSSGFSMQFLDPATQAMLQTNCGASVASQLQHNFGVRFTGSLVAPAAGNYSLAFNSDDGNVLTINGLTVFTQWQEQASGPGSINVALNGGPNPFVFDYYENYYGGADAVLQLPANLAAAPAPQVTTPEPASIVLLGTGLVALGVVGHRRRRA